MWGAIVLVAASIGVIAGGRPAAEEPPPRPRQPVDFVAVPPPSPKAVRFYESGVRLWFVNRAWALAVPALILVTGLSARIRSFAAGRGWPRVLVVATYGVIFLAVDFLLDLPLRYYSGFVRLHEYGLSVQSFGRWLGDALKGLGVEMVGAVLFLWIPYRIMERSPGRWWLYVGLPRVPRSRRARR